MSTKYRYPSELLYEATALADGDWVVVQKDGESRLSKITGANFGNISALAKADGNIIVGDGTNWVAESGATARASLGAQASSANLTAIAGLSYGNDNFIVGNGSTWVAESGATARTSMGAAPAAGDLSVDWSCDDLRSTSGYFYQQASGGSNRGSIELYSAGAPNRMVFRNAAGYQFYGAMSGTTLGDVYAGDYSGDGYYLTGDPDTGMYYAGVANVLAFKTGGTGCAYFDSNGHLLPGTGNTFNLGNTGNRWNKGWFKDVTSTNAVAVDSDQRFKTDIQESDLGLEFVLALRPVRYRMLVRDWERDDRGIPDLAKPIPGVRPHYGFQAQHVKEVMGARDFGGYIDDEQNGGRLGLRYGEFIAPMAKAIQELHGQLQEERQARLALEQRLAVLEMALGPSGASRAKV